MRGYPPTFDELYAVSDLHLGGPEGFQVFNRGNRLGAFIRQIAHKHPEREVALVLNGDIIDSLAEDGMTGYVALSAATAECMMHRIYKDPSFEPVWSALRHFIQTPKRHLIVVAGNHDIELGLPVVEDSVRRYLTQGQVDAWSRIHFAAHGSGFGCKVGEAGVFCTHGNELDPWNWVDQSALGQLANAMSGGRSIEPSRWKPNAGTQLVIDIMNHVKRRFPFVDLLKPETAAVATVLMVLDKDLFKKIDLFKAVPILKKKQQGVSVTKNLLGHEFAELSEEPTEAAAQELIQQLLGDNLSHALNPGKTAQLTEDELLQKAADPNAREDVDFDETLGIGDFIAGRLGLISKEEAMRNALKDWLQGDLSFDFKDPHDPLFEGMKERIAGSVSFVITGHSHKPRAMSYDDGRHFYNCGTWIRRLRLTQEALSDKKAFADKVWPALTAGTMRALDRAKIPGPDGQEVSLVLDETHAVHIYKQGHRVVGDLLRVSENAKGTVVAKRQPGTEQKVAG